MMKNLLASLLVMFLAATVTVAQDVTVTGRVSDENGEALIGASVVVQGTTTGTITDANGDYRLSVPANSSLVFSFIGYLDQTISVGNQSSINISLQPDVTELSEVVVTAFGIEKEKKALGFSVTEVNGGDLVEAREVNLGDALQGRVAGVNVSNIGTGVGGSSRVVIRGNTSINGNNQPLYVIDGVPMDNSNQGQAGMWGGSDWGDGLSSINPDDIASISVLKGNTAAALYGSRASNGVILITTKMGTSRKGIGVEFNSNFVAERINNFFDFQEEYGHGTRGNKPATAIESWDYPYTAWGARMDGSPVPNPYNPSENVAYENQGNNWDKFYRTGTAWTNTLALTGGNDKQSFRFSFSDLRNNSVTPNSGMNRQTATLSTRSKWADKLTLEAKIQYAHEDVNNRSRLSDAPANPNFTVNSLASSIDVEWMKGDPNKPGANPDGTELLPVRNNIFSQNPYWATEQFVWDNTRDRVIGSALLRYDLTDWLYVHGRIGMDYWSDKRKTIDPYGTGFIALGRVGEQNRTQRETNVEFLVGGQKNFGEFGVNVFVGGNSMYRQNEFIGVTGSNMNIPFFHTVQNGANQSIGYDITQQAINSVFGSAEFSYGNFLFLNVTARNDWFSTLNPELNSILYPSVSTSFVLSDVVTLPSAITFAKVRAAWAQVGTGASPYQTQLNYGLVGQGHNAGFGQAALGRINNGSVPNSLLQPATVTEMEIGFDARFLNNRIGIDYAYYDRTTTEDIVSASISGTSGYGSAIINVGEVSNKGHELLLTGTPIQGDFKWDITLNYAYNDNQVTQLAGDIKNLRVSEARSRNAYIEHRIEFTDEATGEVVPGGYSMIMAFRPQMIDGQMVLDADGLPIRESQLSVMGSGVHPNTGGIMNNFSYKNINFSFLVDYKFGGYIYSGTNQNAYGSGRHMATLEGRENGLTVTGVDANGTPVSFTHPAGDPNNSNLVTIQDYYGRLTQMSANYVDRADFMKLRQLVLGYTFPKTLLDKTPFTSVNLSFVGRNLWLIHSKIDNIDPESTYDNSNGQGLEWNGVPQSRTYGFNLNLKF